MVGSLVLFSLVWSRLLFFAVAVGAVYWIIRWLATKKFSVRTPADWGVFLLVLLAGLNLVISPKLDISAPQILRMLCGVLLFYAIVNWMQSDNSTSTLIAVLALAGIGLSLFALISVEWVNTKIPSVLLGFFRSFTILVSDAVNPNVMAGTLLLIAPVVLAVLLFNSWSSLAGKSEKVVYILSGCALIAMTVIILLSFSRAAWMAYIAVLALMFSLRWRWGWLTAILLAGIVAMLWFLYTPPILLGTVLESQSLGSLAGRLEVWSRAVYIIQTFPFSGVGMGLFPEVVDILYPLLIVTPEIAEHAHNLYLQIAVDLGLPGLIAWLSVLIVVFIASWKLFRKGSRDGERWMAGLGAGFFCSAAAVALHGLVDAVIWGMVRQAPLVWLIWGAAIAAYLMYAPRHKSRITATKTALKSIEI